MHGNRRSLQYTIRDDTKPETRDTHRLLVSWQDFVATLRRALQLPIPPKLVCFILRHVQTLFFFYCCGSHGAGVGKSCLLLRYSDDQFSGSYISTIGYVRCRGHPLTRNAKYGSSLNFSFHGHLFLSIARLCTYRVLCGSYDRTCMILSPFSFF